MARLSDAEIVVLLREQRHFRDLGDLAPEDERLFVERFRATLLRRVHAGFPSLSWSQPEVVSRLGRSPVDRGAA